MSATALMERYAQRKQKRDQNILDTADVLRDVEKRANAVRGPTGRISLPSGGNGRRHLHSILRLFQGLRALHSDSE
jgi:hypothetical protein